MSDSFDSVLREERALAPPAAFKAGAHIRTEAEYQKFYRESVDHPERFWPKVAKELYWHKPWKQVLDWSDAPFAKWFVGGQTNLAYNCLDRHLNSWRRNKAAIIWEGEPGDVRTITYAQLHREVCQFANVLEGALGVRPGDRVAIYMPMIPEAVVAMLACARIGAVHSVIFGGFAAQAIVDRVSDAEAHVIITADGGWRRGQVVPLKKTVDEALEHLPGVRHVVVASRCGLDVTMKPGRDHAWDALMKDASAHHEAPALDAEHPLFILYTSGTTGKPKGVLHTTGGYMVGTFLTSRWVFDLKDSDVYWCTADIGWVTGHSYVVYGPLACGATVMMYEGAPNAPANDRFWAIIARHRVSILYTAPTAIRTFMKWGVQEPEKHDLSSLRLLGSVGEPINPEAWMWYHKHIGGGRCPVVDTWWQTETGSILITTLPGAMKAKPGSAGRPFFGVVPAIVDKEGHAVPPGKGGYLVLKHPWPSIFRTLYKDPERFKSAYWAQYPGLYTTGDGAHQDRDGYYWLMGRVDDVINVSGHRLGTMEIESALVSHPKVAEAAVVPRPDEMKGSAIIAFVTLKGGTAPSAALKEELRAHVAHEIGALARPDQIRWATALPKTRSGKIMRRLLRELAAKGEVAGDTTTLEDMSVIAALSKEEE